MLISNQEVISLIAAGLVCVYVILRLYVMAVYVEVGLSAKLAGKNIINPSTVLNVSPVFLRDVARMRVVLYLLLLAPIPVVAVLVDLCIFDPSEVNYFEFSPRLLWLLVALLVEFVFWVAAHNIISASRCASKLWVVSAALNFSVGLIVVGVLQRHSIVWGSRPTTWVALFGALLVSAIMMCLYGRVHRVMRRAIAQDD